MSYPFLFNQLNQFHPELIAESYDPDETTPLGTLSKLLKEYHEPDILKGKDSFTGIVLREEKSLGPSKYFRVRVPELHAHVPIPNSVDSKDKTANHIINLYPIMQVSDKDMITSNSLKPGSIIRSSFQDLNNLGGGIIDSVIDDSTAVTQQINNGYKNYFDNANANTPTSTFRRPIVNDDRTPPPNLKNTKLRSLKRQYQNKEPNASIIYQSKDCTIRKAREGGNQLHWRKGGTIGSAGCGLGAFSMALSGFGVIKPIKQLAELFVNEGYRKCAGGTNGNGFVKIAPKFGIKCTPMSFNAIKSISSQKQKDGSLGVPVIALARGPGRLPNRSSYGYFTSGGHYVLLNGYKDGKFLVYNPWSGGRQGWVKQEFVQNDCIYFWAFTK